MTLTNCLTASMLEVGMRHQERLIFSREQVDRYCTLSGDWNAIHRDLEAARLRFPEVKDIIVPGGLIQICVTGIFGTRFPGDGCLGLTFTPERFRKPVCPGDEITVTIEVTRIKGAIVEVEVTLDDDQGTRISTAKSKLVPPDETYHQWWEQSVRPTGTG
jgi:acyl dehydratase